MTDGVVRVMTANLWTWHCRPEGLATVLRSVDPDVLAVQELHERTAAVVADHFPHHVLRPDGDTLGTGVAARHPFDVARLPTTHRGGWIASLRPPQWPQLGGRVDVINMHFANPLGWPWWRGYRLRRREVETLGTHLSRTETPTVVVGDFNASPAWPLYRRMRRLVADGAVSAGTVGRTWRFRGLGPPVLRIDHVFVAGGRTLRTWTVPVPGADHLGLVAEIGFD